MYSSKSIEKWFKEYVNLQKKLLSSISAYDFEILLNKIKRTIVSGNKVIVAGNGGSLSNAQHFICDLNKGVGDKCKIHILGHALGSNPSLTSAISNDYSYKDIFVRELKMFDNKTNENPLFIGISVSGNSPNVVKAMDYATKTQMHTVAIVGNNGDNKMGKLAEFVIRLNSKHFGRVEDVTMTLLHMCCYYFMENTNETM